MENIPSAHGVFRNYSELISTAAAVLSRNVNPYLHFGGMMANMRNSKRNIYSKWNQYV